MDATDPRDSDNAAAWAEQRRRDAGLLDTEPPAVLAQEYRLSRWYDGNFPDSPKSRYVHAEGSPWTVGMYRGHPERDEATLYVILGDMGYHDISVDELRRLGPDEAARVYDETGAEKDLRELLTATLAFLDAEAAR